MEFLKATDFQDYFKPSPCELRVYLKQQPEITPAPPNSFEQVLQRLGERLELAHLETFPEYLNLLAFPASERFTRTQAAVQGRVPILYQPLLQAEVKLAGQNYLLRGQPDFLVARPSGYSLREVKLAQRISADEHPEINLQLQIYGWLYEQVFQTLPPGLEIYTGRGEIEAMPYTGAGPALALLAQMVAWRQASSEPYSPVGWSKCNGCPYHHYCWERAKQKQDVAMVMGVDQSLARAWQQKGITNINDLLLHFNVSTLAEFKRPQGLRQQRVGKTALTIWRMAQALAGQQEIPLAPPPLPDGPNYVMFDLEGMPPYLDEMQKIYLWGLQVFGQEPGPYQAALADFGAEGDRLAWEEFLHLAQTVLEHYGDLPFVHWAGYEKANINLYLKRYGDRAGIGERVKRNLLDLLSITHQCVALPLFSYSLKVVERYLGFKRRLQEYGGDWSMAKYIEAVETEDTAARQAVMEQIRTYNQEDLAATWHVWQWLQSKKHDWAMAGDKSPEQ